MTVDANPFAVLSLIVAPAIMTNASTVLAMSTGNRLARAVDWARKQSQELEDGVPDAHLPQHLKELSSALQRALLLLRALRALYVALGGFAVSALVSLIGAVFVPIGQTAVVTGCEVAGVLAGLVAVAALVRGASLLFGETRIAVQILEERAEHLQRQFQPDAGAVAAEQENPAPAVNPTAGTR
jgi:hypothetical protein